MDMFKYVNSRTSPQKDKGSKLSHAREKIGISTHCPSDGTIKDLDDLYEGRL
jgi:hypothetical protein